MTKKALTLDATRRIAGVPKPRPVKNGWNVVVAIIEDGGDFVHLHRMDQPHIGNVK
jgi:uncharacterized protein GlcG (DUF336 family)